MKNYSKTSKFLSIVVLAIGASITQQANAGKILLSGADSWELHGNTTFGNQIKTYLGGGKIAFINNYGVSGAATVNGVGVTGFSSIGAAAASLSGFSTLAFASPGACCNDPASAASLGIGTGALTIEAFLQGGGNLYVEDFGGMAQWNAILGFDSSSAIVTGVNGVSGADNAIATAAGVAGGFTTGPYNEGNFAHQWYNTAFFTSHGYTTLIAGGPGSPAAGSSILVSTEIVSAAAVPEPTSIALFAIALAGVAFIKRKQA